jgi:hypothetical protein
LCITSDGFKHIKRRRFAMKLHMDARIFGGIVLGWIVLVGIIKLGGYCYATRMVARAHARGLYSTAEAAMRQLIAENFTDIQRVTIFYAGPNGSDGNDPHVWYVIAEVHAASRADGSDMGKHGCDAPGTFFLQTREGWFHVPEGAFPRLLGKWMRKYGLAGS